MEFQIFLLELIVISCTISVVSMLWGINSALRQLLELQKRNRGVFIDLTRKRKEDDSNEV